MANPLITSTGSVSGAGPAPNADRSDIVAAETVSLADDEVGNVGASYEWEFVDLPVGSATALVGPLTATPSFVPDVAGTYWIRTTVDGSESSEVSLAVLTANLGARIPAFGERGADYTEGGNVKGWHPAIAQFMTTADATAGRTPTTGNAIVTTVAAAAQASHDSDVPLVVGQVSFDPSVHQLQGATRTITFRAVAANLDGAITTHVILHNVTDNDEVADISVTGTTPFAGSQVLVVGGSPGEVPAASRIYEVRLIVDSPVDGNDVIELGSAHIEVKMEY